MKQEKWLVRIGDIVKVVGKKDTSLIRVCSLSLDGYLFVYPTLHGRVWYKQEELVLVKAVVNNLQKDGR